MTIFIVNKTGVDFASFARNENCQVWTTFKDAYVYVGEPQALSVLDWVDGVIIDIADTSPDMHYVLAQAIILQKPTLCLYKKNNRPREILAHLRRKNIPKSLEIKSYTESNISDVIHIFLSRKVIEDKESEVPSIKFTLRLTPSLDNYLTWLAETKKINKAEFIRGILKQSKKSDDDYNKSIK
ncbi:MAG: hypothetical protein Q8P90_04180 [bacterium]|nr:hypothetical protein [bacterium]